MPRKKKRKVEETPSPVFDHAEMHEKKKITIDVKKYWLEEIALLLGEFYQAHDQYRQDQRKKRPL